MIDYRKLVDMIESREKLKKRINILENKIALDREYLNAAEFLELIENTQLLREARKHLNDVRMALDAIVDDPSNYVGCTYR